MNGKSRVQTITDLAQAIVALVTATELPWLDQSAALSVAGTLLNGEADAERPPVSMAPIVIEKAS